MTRENKVQNILTEISDYYSTKITTFGATPQGVDWNGAFSQTTRFEQLAKIIAPAESFSIYDLGCGYGALYDYLNVHYKNFTYTGLDISEEMILAAQRRDQSNNTAKYILANEPQENADYGIASGIFNVRLERSDDEWYNYLETTLDLLDRTSNRGFAFNCLTSYSDLDKMRDYLYYADSCKVFDLCKRKYSKEVALLHDYGLYEFTILVRKNR
jgi:SAM-dependent methyltransferase